MYTEVNTETVVYITEEPDEPEAPFVPGVSDGAILRCSVPPAEYCPTYDDDVSGQRTVWSATLTAREFTIGGTVLVIGYSAGAGSLSDTEFDFGGTTYKVGALGIGNPASDNKLTISFVIDPSALAENLALQVGPDSFAFGDAIALTLGNVYSFTWSNHGLSWSDNESVAVKLVELPPPNAYGYRTIWTALMTAEDHPTDTEIHGYYEDLAFGSLTNNMIVDGRDETVTIGTGDQPQYPWTGVEIRGVTADSDVTELLVSFNSDPALTPDDVAGWTLTLGGGVELPFADATQLTTNNFTFAYDPNWTAGDQVVVSIRTKELQKRIGQVNFRSRRSTSLDSNDNIVYGKTHFIYDRSNGGKFGRWELQRLDVTTDKTGDTDPVWITATFRAPDADTGYQGWWEGQFDDFHTLFLRWIYHVDGIGKGEANYTLPLRTAATEGGIRRSSSGRDISFKWVRTYKEFQRRHLDLANHSDFSAHMLAPPQPATARAGGEGGDGDNLQRVYVPTTVRVLAGEAALRSQALVDTLRSVALLLRKTTVLLQDPVDHPTVRVQLGTTGR